MDKLYPYVCQGCVRVRGERCRIPRKPSARAEAAFNRKEQQAREGAKAWAEYEAQRRAVAEKTERLRALRLEKEAAESTAGKR